MSPVRYGFATPFAMSQTEVDYDFLRAIKDAGYDYVELAGTLLGSLSEDAFLKLKEFLSSLGLRCTRICAFLPARLNCFTSNKNEFNDYLEMLFYRFSELRVESVGFGSGATRQIPEDWDFQTGKEAFVGILRELFLPYLTSKDIALCIEPLRTEETNFISTVKEAAEIVTMLDDPHFGIVADTMHMMTVNEDPEITAASFLPMIKHFHVSELNRKLPVEAFSAKCEEYIRAFFNHGYDKTVSFETCCESTADLSKALKLIKNL